MTNLAYVKNYLLVAHTLPSGPVLGHKQPGGAYI